MRSFVGLSLLMLPPLLATCTSDGDDYCDRLADATGTLRGADPRALDQEALDALRDTAGELYDSAPGIVVDDWRVVVAAYERLDTTLDDAGLSADVLADLQDGTVPDAEALDRFDEIAGTLDEIMTDDELEMAADAIATHAASECDVDMTE